MKKYTLYLLNITHDESTNGVDRYVSCLLSGLEKTIRPDRLYHIRLVSGGQTILHRTEELPHYTRITIPLPEQAGTIIGEAYWSNKYNQIAGKLIQPYIQNAENPIIHIHTLNLIDLALEIKTHTPVKIITHLHCIPWKFSFNENAPLFNYQYKRYQKGEYDKKFYNNHGEEKAYQQCDRLITCSTCGKEFVQNIAGIAPDKIALISNGIADSSPGKPIRTAEPRQPVKLLFAGTVIPAKGIFFILEALRLVINAGYAVELYIAGTGPAENLERIQTEFSDVPTHLLGLLPFDRLQAYYQTCHIGIIGSVQEQNSYVAIEMAMSGLPVVTTAIDGLDEMFTDQVNARKVPVAFDYLHGLTVDIGQMSRAVIDLIDHPAEREKLSHGIRRLYEQNYTLNRMTEQVVQLYDTLYETR